MIVRETVVASWEELKTWVIALNTLKLRYSIEPHYSYMGFIARQQVTKYKVTIYADEPQGEQTEED